jgi:hypothetical protein
LDGDGDQDLSFSGGKSKEIRSAVNPGDGSANWSSFTIGRFPEADYVDRCLAADLNGDGRTDVVATEENSGTSPDALACWWEQPKTRTHDSEWSRHTIVTQFTMNSLDLNDIDRDGDVDLVLAEHRGKKGLDIWINDGKGNFVQETIGTGHESHLGGRLADLDGDGDLDLVSIAYDAYRELHLWRNDTRSSIKLRPQPD